ncbi:hypothetical protein PHSY_006821 [Pseudozyma hubeiensis SY62]|uniref:Uncharacterized protein n=1 Tax=Pseudozyma hubeiensis (strain SY62) TaxID=1305764 RepID=R9PCY6_PSEHS|nr:hypothetical protein PHSY_006821 [Pseudozyma hubeiensis SY62]GAC99221.1 hypothetical protein PHSY_006821 [Pseudozyma hubeiensis SY62]
MSSQPANDLSLSTSTSPFNGRNSATPSSPTSQQRPPFYARFSRRPRTSSNANQSPFAASTSNLLASSNGGSGFASLIRSSSSSQVHLPSPTDHATTASPERNASRPSRISFQTRLSSPNLDSIPQASTMTSTNASATNASSGAGGGGGTGSALGRMFRRYSQSGNARSESQRSTTRDRDSFNMPRNTSSPALDRDTGSPMRVSTNSAVASPALARSGSHAANLSTPISGDTTAAITGSRTLASIPSASAAASPASGSPAVAASATASTQTQPSSQDANSAPRLTQTTPEAASTDAAAPGASASPASTRPLNGMHRIRLVPHLEATRSLHFEPIERDLKEGAGAVKVGRFTDRQPSQRDPIASTLAGVVNEATSSGEFGTLAAPAQSTRGQPGARGGAIPISGSHGGGGRIDSSRIAFKSKVVSRGHAEIWCEPGGKFFIRDTKSSSGTFLNHIRLSGPNLESKPFAIKDGDVVQLGVDYQGGTEEIYRCVKMRVELNRGWQREANQFNVNAFRQLRALQGTPLSPPTEDKGKVASTALPTNRQSVSVTDCCICLFSVTVCQALFIAPCSHVFHYKCIRPLLNLHHPGFSCPLCRTFADLDADVEEDEAWQVALEQEAAAAEARLALGKQPLEVGTPAVELDAPIAAAMAPTLTTALLNGDVGRESTAPRLPFTATASPLLADLQTGHAAPPRGTAALSRRKNDWARPDTAVGSSAGPLAGDETFAVMESHAETAGLSAELGEMMVTDRLLNENPAANVGTAASLHRAAHGASETGSPLRRGSGPIAIGNSDRAMHGQRATPSSSALTGPAAQGSLDEGWPTVGTVGGFSPGLDESGTPLNSTFLSTLAEAPQVGSANHSPSSGRDFPPGRSAPAKTPVPAIITAGTSRPRLGEDGANDAQFADPVGARTKRSSGEGGEDVDTAEEEMGGPATFGGATLGSSGGAGPAKGKAKVDGQTLTFAGDVHHDLVKTGDGSVQVPHKVGGQATPASGDFGAKSTGVRGYSRSRSRSRSGRDAMQSDSDDQEAAPFQSYELPPVPRTGPNLNASAYMHNSPGGQSHSGNGGSARQTGGNGGNAENVSSPASPASESKMARLKRRISHAM